MTEWIVAGAVLVAALALLWVREQEHPWRALLGAIVGFFMGLVLMTMWMLKWCIVVIGTLLGAVRRL